MTKSDLMLQQLRYYLIRHPSCKVTKCPNLRLVMKKKESLHQVRKKLRNLFVDAISCQRDEETNKLRIRFKKTKVFNRKSWDNVSFSQRKGVHVKSTDPKAQPFVMRRVKWPTLIRLSAIAAQILKSLQSDGACNRTVRHVYYLEKRILRDQVYTRNQVHDIAATIRVPRLFLNVYGSCWGSICGNFVYRTDEDSHSGSVSALQTVPKANQILSIKSPAKYVLIIETDATAQALVERKIQQTENCILIASRGFPDANTRQMVHLLWHHLHIPIFVMTDCDPSGMEIMCNYRFGSLSMAYDSASMVCPAVRWLGIFPHQATRCNLRDYSSQRYTVSDWKKVAELKSRPYIQSNPQLMKCVKDLDQSGRAVELEAFTDDGADFLAEELIPHAISNGHWV